MSVKSLLYHLLLSMCVGLLGGIVRAEENPHAQKLPTPTAAQLAWQEAELGVLISYELHTFKDGRYHQPRDRVEPIADVNRFNPTQLDTDQWIRAVKEMGAKFAILTASHESGFRLWQSDVNPYCLKAVRWGDGRRDLVGEFVASCRKYGIKPGIYMGTRWNSKLGVYDYKVTKRSTISQEDYNRMIEGEVKEICTRYGELFEIWFDGGAYGPKEGGPDVLSICEKYQPNVLFYHNYQRADARWGGTESGTVPYPCWATLPFPDGYEGRKKESHADGFRLLKYGDPNGKYWCPAMSDAPLRGNGGHEWFWEPGDDRLVFPLNTLLEKYNQSVGRNSTLILGLTPDTRGLLPEVDVNRCREFGRALRHLFSEPVAETSGRGTTLELPLPADAKFDHLVLQEDIRQGERVRRFKIEYLRDGKWTVLNEGSCIGHKRIIKIDPLNAEKLRLTVEESLAEPILKTFSVYNSLRPRKEEPLKVLSFNILQSGKNAANVGFKNEDYDGSRIDEIAEVIRNSGAQIVGLQELYAKDNSDKELMPLLGKEWTRQGTILSKFKLTPIETEDFFSICRVHLDDRRSVIVINTHWTPTGKGIAKIDALLKAGEIPKDRRKLEEEILTIQSLDKGPRGYLRTVEAAQKYLRAGETVFITGDFNEPSHLDWTDFYALRGPDRLVKNPTGTPLNFKIGWRGSRLLAEAGLKDAYRIVHNNEVAKPGITWTPPYPKGTPGRTNYDDQTLVRIDFIYFGGEKLTAVDAAVIGEERKYSDIVFPRRWPSDHRAVLATFLFD